MDNQEIINVIDANMSRYQMISDKVLSVIQRDSTIKKLTHSIKTRFKDISHVDEKITRKNAEARTKSTELITPENVLSRITDIAGIRLIHLHMGQFVEIHQALMSYVQDGELFLHEEPKAYSWDPEYVNVFNSLSINAEQKESFYTSVHYLFKAREDNQFTCELQVRTLFEEAWGEIDHIVNYPNKSESLAVKEQLKVLARLVSTGSRLSESIFKLHASTQDKN
ncbi:RelA/SpoT domain-containing protein [Aeromonas dhakensis]|uniref:RelA/SpoT domain-containing protein n=1 Tax=Aeromonas dhakensis TaxID=196024 RepID=UPI001B35E6E1|nr:RelA/SpoT domain-containing protein [Aeromonas dhakensis]MBQ4679444.1 (p)ppGpp synthetase [Aeromonas dhakensis]